MARSGSSRLTVGAGVGVGSELRASVSFITSAANDAVADVGRGQADAVDRDRVAVAPARRRARVSTVSRTPSPERSRRATVPRSCDQPGEHGSPLLHPGRDQQVLADALALERQRPDGVGDQLDALALERVAGGPRRRARSARGTGGSRRSRRRRGTRRRGAGRPRAGSRRSRPRRAGRAPSARAPARSPRSRRSPRRRGPRARRSRSAARRARRRPSAGSGARRGRACEVSGSRAERVEHDPPRLALDALDARGELRIVGQRGADPDRDGVALGAPVVGAASGSPRRRSTSSRRCGWRPCRRASSPT